MVSLKSVVPCEVSLAVYSSLCLLQIPYLVHRREQVGGVVQLLSDAYYIFLSLTMDATISVFAQQLCCCWFCLHANYMLCYLWTCLISDIPYYPGEHSSYHGTRVAVHAPQLVAGRHRGPLRGLLPARAMGPPHLSLREQEAFGQLPAHYHRGDMLADQRRHFSVQAIRGSGRASAD